MDVFCEVGTEINISYLVKKSTLYKSNSVKEKGKSNLRTGHEGPERSSGIAPLLL